MSGDAYDLSEKLSVTSRIVVRAQTGWVCFFPELFTHYFGHFRGLGSTDLRTIPNLSLRIAEITRIGVYFCASSVRTRVRDTIANFPDPKSNSTIILKDFSLVF